MCAQEFRRTACHYIFCVCACAHVCVRVYLTAVRSGLPCRYRDLRFRFVNNEPLLFVARGAHRKHGLSVFILHHLQRDLRAPSFIRPAPEVDFLAVRHHHGEVSVLALPLHAVHGLHAREVQLFSLSRQVRLWVRVPWRVQQHGFLCERAVFPLPHLQQSVTALLQHALLQHARSLLLHHREREDEDAQHCATTGLSKRVKATRGLTEWKTAVSVCLSPTAHRHPRSARADVCAYMYAWERERVGLILRSCAPGCRSAKGTKCSKYILITSICLYLSVGVFNTCPSLVQSLVHIYTHTLIFYSSKLFYLAQQSRCSKIKVGVA